MIVHFKKPLKEAGPRCYDSSFEEVPIGGWPDVLWRGEVNGPDKLFTLNTY